MSEFLLSVSGKVVGKALAFNHLPIIVHRALFLLTETVESMLTAATPFRSLHYLSFIGKECGAGQMFPCLANFYYRRTFRRCAVPAVAAPFTVGRFAVPRPVRTEREKRRRRSEHNHLAGEGRRHYKEWSIIGDNERVSAAFVFFSHEEIAFVPCTCVSDTVPSSEKC